MLSFKQQGKLDIIPVGRLAIDFNPTDFNRPLSESSNFNKYVGGSPANIAVGMARLGDRVGFLGKVSDDQFGDYVTRYFENEGIDTSHITRCTGGENLGLTFTEMLSPTESSILMYREGAADLKLSPEDVDEEIDYRINFTFDKAQKRDIRYALSNTFGFGGHNACLIFKKWEGE